MQTRIWKDILSCLFYFRSQKKFQKGGLVNMVATFIKGRLGNQMFQYAFSKAVKLAQGDDAPLIFDFHMVHNAGKQEDGFEDALKYFNVEKYKTEENLMRKYASIFQKLLYLLYKLDGKFGYLYKSRESWYSFFRNHGLLFVSHNGGNAQYYYPIYHKYLNHGTFENIICNGYFAVPALFEHIKPILMEEFTPKLPPRSENLKLYDVINSTNSVCVSIRRGDYLDERNKNKFLVCDINYYNAAIRKAKDLVQKPVFVFFSDDIEWVKSNISTDAPSFYESGKDPVWEVLRLMYCCKHFIISNSTFSWWAQYLSRNSENKVVISPDHWFNIKMDFPSSLISKEFVTIACDYH